MAESLTYDGQTLTWLPGGQKFKATSGLLEPGKDATGASVVIDHQVAAEQCVRDAGPIPEGRYYLEVRFDPKTYAVDDGSKRCNLRSAGPIQIIPRGGDTSRSPLGAAAGMCEPYWANWGWRRVQLKPADAKTAGTCHGGRSGFYLHDSTKGYTHGCIEVEGAFFDKLIKLAKSKKQARMSLVVDYKDKTTSTYGGTYIPAPSAGP